MRNGTKRRHSEYGDYALTGKLFCGRCGAAMVGISGTGKSGKHFYYYTCNKKRLDHACDKQNVKRDQIEQLVASAIREHILTDEMLDLIADKTLEHNRRIEEESSLGVLEDQLAQTESAISNVMQAIERGIITETTKSRLVQLEAERSDLKGKISAARADIIVITKEQILSTLQKFRAGDINDPVFRSQLFDTFLTAVYVYDDYLKILFSFCKDHHNAREIPFLDDLPDDPPAPDGVCISSPGLHQKSAIQTPRFLSEYGVFVLLVPLPVRA